MKQIAIVIGILLAGVSFIYGAILPYGKASGYISALNNMQNVHSVQGFKDNFDTVFNFYSPVGSEELTKFLSSDVVNLISQEQQPEGVARELVTYIEPHLMQNNPRHLLTGAQMYTVLWLRFHQQSDYNKAVEYYKKVLAIGPNLPPALYGLADLYNRAGDKANLSAVAKTILSYWPDATSVKPFVQK